MGRKPVRHAWENNFAHLETKENKFRLESYEALTCFRTIQITGVSNKMPRDQNWAGKDSNPATGQL